MIEVPLAVVARKLSGSKKQTSEFPVGADLLEHERNGIGAFLCRHIENCYTVSSGRQVRNYKLGTVGGLPGSAKDSTQKLSPRHGSSTFGLQLIWAARGRVGTRKVRLVLLDRCFHSGKVIRQRRNCVLLERCRISSGSHVEVSGCGTLYRGAGTRVHLVRGDAGLRQS